VPFLDVTSVLFDPDFADKFNVRRRAEVMDEHGRSTQVEKLLKNKAGVVTAISPNDLNRAEDYQTMTRSISVICKFSLRGETQGYQPDIVVWKGGNYLVKHVDPYPQFGQGFYQAECSSMDKLEQPI
jgi:hypothetical protein